MATKRLVLTFEGKAETVDAAVDAFVRQYGWTPETVDAEGNPVTQQEKARQIIRQYFLDTVTAYNVERAKELAASQAKTATEQAMVDDTELTLTTMDF